MGWIVNQGTLAIFHTESLKEGASHVVKFDDWNIEVFCHPSHSLWIIGVRLTYLACFVKLSALRWSDKDRRSPLGTSFIDKLLEGISIVVECATSWTFLLLIIMSKLHEYIVTLFHEGHYFLESACSYERCGCLTTFSIVGDCYLIIQPPSYHLSP